MQFLHQCHLSLLLPLTYSTIIFHLLMYSQRNWFLLVVNGCLCGVGCLCFCVWVCGGVGVCLYGLFICFVYTGGCVVKVFRGFRFDPELYGEFRRLVVGGGVVVYRLCGFWLGGGGGFAFLGLSDTVGGVVLVGSLVVSLVWVWGVCQVVTI